MEHEGNNNGNSNNVTVERDSNNNNASDFYVPQTEPPGSTLSLPTSTSPTPSATSPFSEQLISAPVTTTSPTSTLPTVSPTIMVEDQTIQHLISWAPTGDVFSVSNPTEFSKTVLPQYFKHNNWQSFVRQLNMYGFHKVNDMFHANPSSESQAWEFKHPEFRKGQISALQNIKRKSSKHTPSSNSTSLKGGLSNAGLGQSPTSEHTAADVVRDSKIERLTNKMSELMERMHQMNENYRVLYAETVSCRMQQSKHEKVITDIANFLSSMFRGEVDCIQAEVAKFGQGDIPPSNQNLTQHPSHYPREGTQSRSMSTPQPMVGVEPTSNMILPSRMSEVDYRSNTSSSSFTGSQPLHRSPVKIPTSSPLAMLPEFPFAQHYQPSNNYLRHRSPEPITNNGSVSRSSSMDTYRPSTPSSSSSSQSYTTQSRATHPPTHMPMSQHRRSSQPGSSLGFGSDSNLLNPDDKPVTVDPTTSQIRPPPLPDPPDNELEYNKRRKRS
ncbi:11803_t:CDS:2 [Diversispora eburnea]|uniref:11803_t:CDS:1 n=1 Tax=Diversispora eburnea TaxID=1213867 RepID=A0A9N8VJB6_9GLOM|nr:11803_t:CDS:2 [Diversispora eburnea]